MEANPSTDHTWPAHKWQQRIEQQPLLDIIIERLSPQVSQLALSGPVSEALADTGLPILSDQLPGFVGPLAGLLSALEWADQRGGQWVLSCPCDSPFLPLDLYSTLYEAVQKHHTPIAIARSQERNHPVFGLWSVTLLESLRHTLAAIPQERAIGRWAKQHKPTYCEFPRYRHAISNQWVDPFFNINTREDLHTAQALSCKGHVNVE